MNTKLFWTVFLAVLSAIGFAYWLYTIRQRSAAERVKRMESITQALRTVKIAAEVKQLQSSMV